MPQRPWNKPVTHDEQFLLLSMDSSIAFRELWGFDRGVLKLSRSRKVRLGGRS
jgi:hypothetical protein